MKINFNEKCLRFRFGLREEVGNVRFENVMCEWSMWILDCGLWRELRQCQCIPKGKSRSPYGAWLMFSFGCREMRRVVRFILLDIGADGFQVVVAYRLSPDDDDNDICVATRIR